MKSIFDASTGVEAYMMKNMLATYEIESEVLGEHLQGGIGDLQAIGIVRVMVSPEDFDRAKEVVREWESLEVEPTEDDKPTSKSKGFLYFFIGCLVGAAIVFMVNNSPVSTDGIDYDGDGTLEEKWTYNGQFLKRIEIDRNLDGKFDENYYYDQSGLLKSSKYDHDFDGVFEGKAVYREGNTQHSSADLDEDGFYEIRESYTHGVLSSISFYNPRSENLKRIEYYSDGLLTRSETDSDDDGELDTEYLHDRYGEIR